MIIQTTAEVNAHWLCALCIALALRTVYRAEPEKCEAACFQGQEGGRQGQRRQAGAAEAGRGSGGRQGMLPGAGEASQGQAEAGRGRHGHRLCTGVRVQPPHCAYRSNVGPGAPAPTAQAQGMAE